MNDQKNCAGNNDQIKSYCIYVFQTLTNVRLTMEDVAKYVLIQLEATTVLVMMDMNLMDKYALVMITYFN